MAGDDVDSDERVIALVVNVSVALLMLTSTDLGILGAVMGPGSGQ
jgi:hypothetical protein